MSDLYHSFDGNDDLKALLDRSDEDVLVALGGKPVLARVPGTGPTRRARLVSCLLHGNEDSGYRAVLELLREGAHWPFDLWVLIGNVRAASTEGWFAHRYLDDQEDFNRVWGVNALTTRQRRCAAAILDELAHADLEGAIDLHNNTGQNPYYAIAPTSAPDTVRLAGVCCDRLLLWGLPAHTLMQALTEQCPAVAVECGMPGLPEHTAFAATVLRRFLTARLDDDGTPAPADVYEMRFRVRVLPEVRFAFGGVLTDDLDLVLRPGLDGHNFAMLLAGTEIGHVEVGTAMPLVVTDMHNREVTERFLRITSSGVIVATEDLVPVMMTTTVQQTRLDCLFYITRPRRLG